MKMKPKSKSRENKGENTKSRANTKSEHDSSISSDDAEFISKDPNVQKYWEAMSSARNEELKNNVKFKNPENKNSRKNSTTKNTKQK